MRFKHDTGWIRLVGSLKLHISFAKEPYKKDDILQQRPLEYEVQPWDSNRICIMKNAGCLCVPTAQSMVPAVCICVSVYNTYDLSQNRPAYVKRDLYCWYCVYVSVRVLVCIIRMICVKRDLHMSKETCIVDIVCTLLTFSYICGIVWLFSMRNHGAFIRLRKATTYLNHILQRYG